MKSIIYLFFILFFISCGPSQEEFDELKQELAELKKNESNNNEDEELKENNSNQQTNPNVTIEQINPNPTNSKHLKEEDNEEERSRPVENPEPPSGKVETTQEESPVESSIRTTETENPKYNTSDLFGSGNSNQGTGEGLEGTGPNTGGGLGNGDYRTINSRLLNALDIKWNGGSVMVKFIILPDGKVENATVLRTHQQTSITMTNAQKSMIEKQCEENFKFNPISSDKGKEQVALKIQFLLE